MKGDLPLFNKRTLTAGAARLIGTHVCPHQRPSTFCVALSFPIFISNSNSPSEFKFSSLHTSAISKPSNIFNDTNTPKFSSRPVASGKMYAYEDTYRHSAFPAPAADHRVTTLSSTCTTTKAVAKVSTRAMVVQSSPTRLLAWSSPESTDSGTTPPHKRSGMLQGQELKPI